MRFLPNQSPALTRYSSPFRVQFGDILFGPNLEVPYFRSVLVSLVLGAADGGYAPAKGLVWPNLVLISSRANKSKYLACAPLHSRKSFNQRSLANFG